MELLTTILYLGGRGFFVSDRNERDTNRDKRVNPSICQRTKTERSDGFDNSVILMGLQDFFYMGLLLVRETKGESV